MHTVFETCLNLSCFTFRFASSATTNPVNGVRLTTGPGPSDGYPLITSQQSTLWKNIPGITDPFPAMPPSTFSVLGLTGLFSSGNRNLRPGRDPSRCGTRAGSITTEFSKETTRTILSQQNPGKLNHLKR